MPTIELFDNIALLHFNQTTLLHTTPLAPQLMHHSAALCFMSHSFPIMKFSHVLYCYVIFFFS